MITWSLTFVEITSNFIKIWTQALVRTRTSTRASTRTRARARARVSTRASACAQENKDLMYTNQYVPPYFVIFLDFLTLP